MGLGLKGGIPARVSPVEAALALGSAPDPRSDPQGYLNWYNSAQKAANDLMGYRTPEEQAALANFYKQLDIGEGLMQNTASYGTMQGADTTGAGALTNFLTNYMPDTAANAAIQPSQNYIINQALSGAPGYSFADRYIQYGTRPDTGLDRPEGLYDLFPGQQYRVTDLKGNVVYTGTDATKIANEYAPDMRKKGYSIQMSNPETGGWGETWRYVPDPDPLGQFAMMVGPMLGAALFPPLAGLSGSLASAGGAALGSVAGGIAAGQSFGDILKNAAISGGLTYAGGELFKSLGSGAPPTNPSANINADLIPNALSDLSFGPIDSILVTGSRLAAPTGATLAGALNSSGGSNQSSSSGDQLANIDPDITVTGSRIPGFTGAGGAIGTRFSQPFQTYNAENYVPRQTTTDTTADQTTTDDSEIVVTGNEQENLINSLLRTGSIGPLSLNYTGDPVTDAQLNEMVEKNMSQIEKDINSLNANQILGGGAATAGGMTLKDIATYLRLAGYGGSLATALLGGGSGDGSGSGKPAYYKGSGAGSLNPIFSGTLPPSSFGGGTGSGTGTGTGTGSGSLAPRPPSEIGFGGTGSGAGSTGGGTGGGIGGGAGGTGGGVGGGTSGMRDWTEYGFGPEASFFEYVPVRGYSHGGDMSEGRSSFAVRGPGDGRSDDIPAVLSDGEYVMDAETVALLGNGSSKAGADALDRFRINLRKHKGKKLANGEFSVDAKRPEQYLAGGRI